MPLDLTGNTFKKKIRENPQNPHELLSASIKDNEKVVWKTTQSKYQMDDLLLNHSTKELIQDVISFYTYQDKLMYEWGMNKRYKDRINLSINLYGESGTGKTMAAHAIANALGKPIIFVDYAEIESKYVGETSKNIKQLFGDAVELDAIIIFDEADALLSKRVTDMHSSTDVSVNQTRSVLLNILNDYMGIVIFTTNFIQNFDPAFMRRIHYQIRFELPDYELRCKLWEMYIPPEMPTNLEISNIAAKYTGISGSDIANAVFSAAVKAARLGCFSVDGAYFEEAIELVIRSKKENAGTIETITKRIVSDEYVKEQLKKGEER